MRTIHISIIIILLVGIKQQVSAQTFRKAETAIERKEITPVKEVEIREAPHAGAIAQPIQHTEITPAKETEIKQETQTETVPTFIPVEEPKAAPTPEKTEWVKTEPGPIKPAQAVNPNSQNTVEHAQPVLKIPINRQVHPVMRRVSMKPLVIDTTKKP